MHVLFTSNNCVNKDNFHIDVEMDNKGVLIFVERGSSVVECWSRNRGEPGFESSLCCHFKVWAFLFSSQRPSSLSCINEYLAIDTGAMRLNGLRAVIAEYFPEKSSLCWTGMNKSVRGGGQCVKRFERSNGLDTAL